MAGPTRSDNWSDFFAQLLLRVAPYNVDFPLGDRLSALPDVTWFRDQVLVTRKLTCSRRMSTQRTRLRIGDYCGSQDCGVITLIERDSTKTCPIRKRLVRLVHIGPADGDVMHMSFMRSLLVVGGTIFLSTASSAQVGVSVRIAPLIRMYRENSCFRLLIHSTERTCRRRERPRACAKRQSKSLQMWSDAQFSLLKQGPNWVHMAIDDRTGSKLGPIRNELSLVFSVEVLCKWLIFFAWGARGPGFKSRRPDQTL